MGLIERIRIHELVYWAPKGTDAFGNITFEQPIEIKGRWEDGVHEKVLMKTSEVITHARVYVDRVLEPGGYLMRGALETLQVMLPPPSDTAYEIKLYKELPNIRGNKILQWVMI
jgi:hypothetical protein